MNAPWPGDRARDRDCSFLFVLGVSTDGMHLGNNIGLEIDHTTIAIILLNQNNKNKRDQDVMTKKQKLSDCNYQIKKK